MVSYASLTGKPLSIEAAENLLRDVLHEEGRFTLTIPVIQKRVAEHYNIRLSEMHSARRARAVARPRQVAMYLAKQLTTRSLPEIGRKFGGWMMWKFPRIVKPGHIAKTNEFFTRYGGKTIIIARFVPIVRTFAPLVAGTGEMEYRRFMFFNVTGALLWVGLILPAGWFFGNIPVVKQNFELVVLGIIVISVLPMVFEIARAKLKKQPQIEPAE